MVKLSFFYEYFVKDHCNFTKYDMYSFLNKNDERFNFRERIYNCRSKKELEELADEIIAWKKSVKRGKIKKKEIIKMKKIKGWNDE